MSKLIKKLGIKSTILVIIGLLFISLGLVFNFSESKSKISSAKKVHLATGDYFNLRLADQTVERGENATIPIKVTDIAVNSGDKGLGVISFKYEYNTGAFTDIQFSSTVATISVNKSTREVIAVVKNGNIITSTTTLMTATLIGSNHSSIISTSDGNVSSGNISSGNVNAIDPSITSSNFRLTNIQGTSGDLINASDASCTITFAEAPETPAVIDNTKVTFSQNGNDTYATGAGTTVTVESENVRSISYLWVNGTEEPSDDEINKTIQSGGIASTGGGTGDYYLWVLVKLSNGENYKARSNVFKLDNKTPTKPTITSNNATSNQEVGHDVNLTINGSEALCGIAQYEYSLNNGESWNVYNPSTGITITEEGTTTVIARAKNNLGKYSSSSNSFIVKIAREQMVLSYRVSTLEKTNENVTATIRSNTKLVAPAGWTLSTDGYSISKVYTENATETVNVTDENGNSDNITVVINQIDKVSPVVSVNYDQHDDYVTVEVTANEEVDEITGWNLSENGTKLTKIYYHNKTENITVVDLAGNRTTQQINVTGITEGEFAIDVTYQQKSDTEVLVTITSTENLKPLTGWTLSEDKKTLTKTYNDDVSENLVITSENNERKNVAIKYIFPEDEEDDELSITYSNRELTNESVIVTILAEKEISQIEGWELINGNTAITKVYSDNIDEDITINFEDGTYKIVKIKITNIDKDKPIIKDAVDNGVYNTLKLIFNEEVTSVVIKKDGKDVEYQENMILTEEGNYKITLIDKAGNEVTYNITISKNATVVEVPDTGIDYTKILIILGILEILVGLLYIFKFKVNDKINVALVLMILVLSRFSGSSAADAGLTLNGYKTESGNMYNIEATTTEANLKSNLDDDSTTTVTKTSTGNYVSTGDKVKYKNTTYNIIVSGDVNSDGTVSLTDTNAIINHLLSKSKITNTSKKAALDYNQDGEYDISDLYLVNKRVVKNNYVIAAKGINATLGKTTIDAGHSTTVTAKVYPVNAANKTVSYNITSGGSYSSASGNKITGKSAGTSKIRVSVGSVYKDLSYTVKNCYKLHVIGLTTGGDAMVFESNGHYGMIDTGIRGSKNSSTNVYAGFQQIDDYLKNIMDGERKPLDFLMITHFHSDHFGNAEDVIKNYSPKALYMKRYSNSDSSGKNEEFQSRYKSILNEATAKNSTIYEYGISSTSLQIPNRTTNATKTTITLGAFTIKLHNISNEFDMCKVQGTASENLNSLTQSVLITANNKIIRTYLEGDLTKFKYKRSIPSGVKSNGHFENTSKATVKAIVMWQAYDYLGLENNKLDVYKAAHHTKYNSTYMNELKKLRPLNVIGTATQATLYGKDNGNKTLCSVYAVKKYLESQNLSFSERYKTIDKSIVYDYTSGSVKVTGGASWDTKKYPFTSDKIDTTLEACGSLDIN